MTSYNTDNGTTLMDIVGTTQNVRNKRDVLVKEKVYVPQTIDSIQIIREAYLYFRGSFAHFSSLCT